MKAIIEIGSNNTKTHVYDGEKLVYDSNTTIEFKKNYKDRVADSDLEKLFTVIEKAQEYADNTHIFGCSIFRTINQGELKAINDELTARFNTNIQVVSQEDEALYTALGCYKDIDYDKELCVFIGGGGSIELIFVKNKEVVDKKFYDFGVVDVTNKFPDLKNDIPSSTFEEVTSYVAGLIEDIDQKADLLILAGGDHLYWYNNANYKLLENDLYSSANQPYMITQEMNDKYDRDAMLTSLEAIRARSDNPLWFDCSRAMKMITNSVAKKIDAKYVVPTRINMEDGIKEHLSNI
ncbi:MAG: hypothetical protein ACOX0Z_01055 [Candidatus Nanosyncoccaceae bacterium]